MRDTVSWRKNLESEIDKAWPKDRMKPWGYIGEICDIELALFLLSQVASTENGEAVWALLQGYDFGFPRQYHREIATARHLLNGFRSPTTWENALKRYEDSCPDYIRGFILDKAAGIWTKKTESVSVAPNRFNLYAKTLRQPAPHPNVAIPWAKLGSYRFALNEIQVSAEITEEFCFAPPSPHDFPSREVNPSIDILWTDLLETAQWMDQTESAKGIPDGGEPGNWFTRLRRVELRLRLQGTDTLTKSEQLTVDGILHLVGMVSAGKSTLMEVLAVHMARQGKHVTLVLADVIDILRRVALFSRLGIDAAPVLGNSSREAHLNRLHRVVAAEQPQAGLEASHDSFRWLSTACALDGLRQNGTGVLPINNRPCAKLIPIEQKDDQHPKSCPIYSQCEYHRASLDLRKAKIWLATPANLVYTSVAPQLDPNRVRFTEMVYRHSELVIIDEADRVQTLLDAAFSPSEVLMNGNGEAWISRLNRNVTAHIGKNMEVLGAKDVKKWRQSLFTTHCVTEQLYSRLQSQKPIRDWVIRRNYFTAHILFEQLAYRCCGANTKGENGDKKIYKKMKGIFKDFLKAPLSNISDLSSLAGAIAFDNSVPDSRAQQWIQNQLPENGNFSSNELNEVSQQLEIALLVAILQNELVYLLKSWRGVEESLNLEKSSSLLFHRPPKDYAAVLPRPPMGREVAFQYLPPDENPGGPGDLRFFRCEAVGRALMLNFHQLWAGDGVAGPHVMLLSGTSWAGASPSSHVQVPVGGVLQAPDREIEAIKKSNFKFESFRYSNRSEKKGQPIRISGTKDHERVVALRALLSQLAVPRENGAPSILESQRDSLPDHRRRILLLTGSYAEAQIAYDWFVKDAPNRSIWNGKVRVMIPDTAEMEEGFDADQLPRGLVHQFAEGEAWILIAPLMAIERGHNIIDENGKAALGAAYFLVRPHPRPDDISYAIHSINRWAMDESNLPYATSILEGAKNYRNRGRIRWNKLILTRLQWQQLSNGENGKAGDREAVTWTQLVAIWQVIGRLVRGGEAAHVYFCDAAFAQYSAAHDEMGDTPQTSLLISMRAVLRPYFDAGSRVTPFERELVKTLYGPLFNALERMFGLSEQTDTTNSNEPESEQELSS